MKAPSFSVSTFSVLLVTSSASAADTSVTPPEVVHLEAVEVNASRDFYVIPNSSSPAKLDLPVLDTPLSIQIVPAELISDRAERTILDAAKNASGVQAATYQFYDQLIIRGFDSDYGNVFRNGLQLRGTNEAVNSAFADHVEVVKGPASMLYGRIQPGGFVNVATKAPKSEASYSLEQSFGSWNAHRTTVDATGKLSGNGAVLYRLIADWDKADSWVDNAHRDNKAFSGALFWAAAKALTFDLQVEQYDYQSTWLDAGIPVIGNRPADLPRHFSILFPQSWSDYPYRVDRTLVNLSTHLSLSDSWKLVHRFLFIKTREDQQGVYADPFSFDGVENLTQVRFTHNPDWLRSTWGSNLDLSGKVTLGKVQNHLLFGIDWAKFTDDTPGSTGPLEGAAALNVFHPVYADYSALLKTLAEKDLTNVLWRDWSNDFGAYFQDHTTIGERWSLLWGGRYDWATDAYPEIYGNRSSDSYPYNTASPVIPQPEDSAFSPRAGLLFKVTPSLSLYASYSKSFGSANGRDNLGNPLKPQIGEQFEVGAKASLFGGKVNATTSVYDLTKSNITEYDPDSFFPRTVGEARSRGIELDVTGQLTSRLSVFAGYSYDDAKVTKDPFYNTVGHRLGGVAPHTLNLWLKFDSSSRNVSGWTFGAGIKGVSQREGDDGNTWQLPGYATIDAMLGYRVKLPRAQLRFQLNLTNAFDEVYFDHGGYGVAAYGAPRGVQASGSLSF